MRRVVDEDIEPTQTAKNLHGNRVDILLLRHVADDAVDVGMLTCHASDGVSTAGDERHPRAAMPQFANEREPQSGCAAGDRHSEPGERIASRR